MTAKMLAKTEFFSIYSRDGKEYAKLNRVEESSVMVAALDKKKKLFFIEKFLPAHNHWSLVLPGGIVERGEDPKEAVRRELSEEIGMLPSESKHLLTLDILPGYLVGSTHIYLAQMLGEIDVQSDDNEDIKKVIKLNLKKALDKIKKGEIRESRTVAAILYLRSLDY
jgi:ADP-ribose pyrophosphatase